MPGHVGQNDTDFTLLQEELNAPISSRVPTDVWEKNSRSFPGVFHSFSRSIAKIFAGFMRVFFTA